MIDTNEKEGPLPIRREGRLGVFKKRYNVAASRARDQLWVVYSLNPETDLQDGDLRLQLIQHAKDPNAFAREREKVFERTESDFEKKVAGILIDAGYKVIPQWKVGSYRIDMVIEGNGKRLAVECDGDKWHTLDNLQDDLNRQAILERLGWNFVRIRGTQFYRNPEQAMQPVFEQIKSMGITPTLDSTLYIPVAQGNDLLERVKRNAAKLRAMWEKGDGEENVSFESLQTKRWNRRNKTSDPLKIKKEVLVQSENPEIKSAPTIQMLTSQRLAGSVPNKQYIGLRLFSDPIQSIDTDPNGKVSVTQLLQGKGFSFVDKRNKGGALWVIGGKELASSMEEFAKHGYKFNFTPKGGRATRHKPGWYYK
jgi:very-short-patch-repair endonuclease